jgi:hypothetical protein
MREARREKRQNREEGNGERWSREERARGQDIWVFSLSSILSSLLFSVSSVVPASSRCLTLRR